MQIKVNYKDAVKGIKRKQKSFTRRLMGDIHGEAVRQMSNMDVPRVTSTLHNTYGASQSKNKVTFGSGGGGKNMKPSVYAGWIETGKRRGARRIGNLKYYNRDVSRYVTSAPRNVGLGEFKKRKESIVKEIPKIARKININKL